MADETKTTADGATTPPALPPAMAGDGGAKPGVDSVATHAADSAVDFKGLRHGRARKDGLVPGSKESIEADRRYDRIRQFLRVPSNAGKVHPEEKDCPPVIRQDFERRRQDLVRIAAANTRDAERVPRSFQRTEPTPPPLPSAGGPAVPAPGAAPSLDTLADAASNAIVLWRGTEIEPVLSEFLLLVKDFREYKRELQLKAASFSPTEIAEILDEMKKTERLEKMICLHGGEVLAKLLNKAGISAENKSEIFLASAVLGLVGAEIRLSRRISKMVAARKAAVPPSP